MDAVTDEPALIPTRQAAARLGVNIDTVRRAVADGRLPAVRLRERGWLLFRAADIDRLVSGRPAGEAAVLVEADQLRVEEVLIERERG